MCLGGGQVEDRLPGVVQQGGVRGCQVVDADPDDGRNHEDLGGELRSPLVHIFIIWGIRYVSSGTNPLLSVSLWILFDFSEINISSKDYCLKKMKPCRESTAQNLRHRIHKGISQRLSDFIKEGGECEERPEPKFVLTEMEAVAGISSVCKLTCDSRHPSPISTSAWLSSSTLEPCFAGSGKIWMSCGARWTNLTSA